MSEKRVRSGCLSRRLWFSGLIRLLALFVCGLSLTPLVAAQARRKDPATPVPIPKAEPTQVTKILTPTLKSWDALNYKYPANKTYWPCGLATRGTGAVELKDSDVVAGYDRFFDEGTSPAPCKEQINHVYNGIVWFDLRLLVGNAVAVRATLDFKQSDLTTRRDDGSTGSGFCANELYLATADWKGLKANTLVPGDQYLNLFGTGFDSGCGLGGCSIDVTSGVNEWLLGKVPNFGFVVKAHKDSDEFNYQNNGACWRRYSDFQLRLTYARK